MGVVKLLHNIVNFMVNFYSQQNRHLDDENLAPKKDSPVNGKKSKVSYQKYVDPTNEFGAKEFKWAIWYVKNKLLLYRVGLISLIAFCAGTIGFSLWRGFIILYSDFTVKPEVERGLAMSIDYTALHPRFNPAPLEILNSYVLSGGTGKVDVLSEAVNPNLRYIVYFDYYYDFGGIATARQNGYLLPGESRPIAVFGLEAAEYFGSPNLVMENVSFKRIDAHAIADVASWQEERINFSVENFKYSYAGEEGKNAHAVRFTLINNSAYGYKNPKFLLGLYQNGSLVGLMPFDQVDFDSLETREIDLRNFVENLAVSEIRLFPVIDLYNEEVYLPPKK